MNVYRRILITLFVGIGYHLIAQTSFDTESKGPSNIYYHSLKKYCEYPDKGTSQSSTIYIEKNHIITNKLPSKMGSYELIYLDGRGIKKHLKGKKQMILVRIVPLRVKDDNFFVNVIPFTVSYKKRNFNFVNGGGLGVSYEFDVETNGLKFKSAKMGRI